MENYLNLMIESLKKTNGILEEIVKCNEDQTKCLKDDDFTFDKFDQCVDAKQKLIEELLKNDEGFQLLYDRIKEGLESEQEKAKYAKEIHQMQTLIRIGTDLRVEIQTTELRNKNLVEQMLQRERDMLKQNASNSKVALNYYKNMNQVNYVDPQFMDHKH